MLERQTAALLDIARKDWKHPLVKWSRKTYLPFFHRSGPSEGLQPVKLSYFSDVKTFPIYPFLDFGGGGYDNRCRTGRYFRFIPRRWIRPNGQHLWFVVGMVNLFHTPAGSRRYDAHAPYDQ